MAQQQSESTVGELAVLLAKGEKDFERGVDAPVLLLPAAWDKKRGASPDDQTRRGLELAQFLSRTGVIDKQAASIMPDDLQGTKVDDEPAPPLSAEEEAQRPLILASSVAVFLRKTSRNPFAHMITLGRASNNDVILPDASVSKFHAYVVSKPGGQGWTITDQGSTNGTFVDENKLTAGRPTPLADGAVVRFGSGQKSLFYTRDGLKGFLELFRRGVR